MSAQDDSHHCQHRDARDLTNLQVAEYVVPVTGGSGSNRRRAKRCVRCILKGHGWYQYARREGDLIVTKQRCIRCGNDRNVGTRPFISQAGESTRAARSD